MEWMIVIIAMALATYIPRVMPVFFMEHIHFKPWFNKWLRAIPYAALGALIFPGILFVDEGMPIVGILGGLAAAVVALLKGHVLIVITVAVVTVYLVQQFV